VGTFTLAAGGNAVSLDATDTDTTTEAVEGFTVNAGSGDDEITAAGDANFTIDLSNGGDNTVTLLGGNDNITLGAGDDTVDAGAGDDTITAGTNISANDEIDGGEDNDEVTVTFSSAVLGAATIQNVETITINTGANQTGTFDATNVSSGTEFVLEEGGTADNAVAIENMVSGSNVTIQDVGGVTGGTDFQDNVTLTVADEAAGTADSLTVNLNSGAAFGLTTTADLETLNLVVGGLGDQDLSAGSDIKANTIVVTSAEGRTDNLDLGTVGADVTTVDASTFDGDLTVTGASTEAMTITGGSGADTLQAGSAASTIDGNGGDDNITMQFKADDLSGGETGETNGDTLTVDFTGVGGAAIVDLTESDQVVNFNGQVNSTVQEGFENVNFSNYNNSAGLDFTGDDNANTVVGTADNDVIKGASGADVITGGNGGDSLTGDAGSDTFVYSIKGNSQGADGDLSGVDHITDFDLTDDSEVIDTNTLGGVGAVAAVNTEVSGTVDEATLEANLNTLLNVSGAGFDTGNASDISAAMVDVTGGDLAGRSFLAIDVNADDTYTNADDMLIELTGFSGVIGDLDAADFA
jgi:hypothetical protein